MSILLSNGFLHDDTHRSNTGREPLTTHKSFEESAMTRITIPTADQTPAASQPLLAAVNKQLGVVPNMMKLIGNSPAALEGYLSLNGALGKGTLGAKTGERIALAVAELNNCSYCLSAHSYLASNLAKLDDLEIIANRKGASNDPKADAAVKFASKIVVSRGQVTSSDIDAVKTAGFSNAEIIEIIVHVGLNTLTNYVNEVAKTEVDFPLVKPFNSNAGHSCKVC
jgi:uncharacterized peroxidase-related enzyme